MKTDTTDVQMIRAAHKVLFLCEQNLNKATCSEIASLARGIAASAAKIAGQYEGA